MADRDLPPIPIVFHFHAVFDKSYAFVLIGEKVIKCQITLLEINLMSCKVSL